jgi:hypothetical protein
MDEEAGDRPSLGRRLYDLRRRVFGRYTLEDPRPIKREAPYTFYLPPRGELAAIEAGDLVKLMFRGVPPSPVYDVERKWVTVTAAQGERLTGVLDSDPFDMPQLRKGALVAFERYNVTDILKPGQPIKSEAESYESDWVFHRCLTDEGVSEGRLAVHYIYREAPEMTQEGDRFPDTGWRIRGDYRGLTDEEFEAREVEYIAIGKVLNQDDSWVHLKDAPVGSAFIRNFETGEFEPDA